jgi:lysophospholipase L1-like esterase
VKFPHIISLPRRSGTRLASLLLALSVIACGGDPPTTPQPTPSALGIACPTGMSSSSINGQPLALTFAPPTTTGGTAPVSVSCTPASGTLFSNGATDVTCFATDAAGRNATCAFSVVITAVPTLTRTRFVAFGDSLTEGKVSLGPVILVDAGPHSYPAKVRSLLMARYTSQSITVINEGWGGERAGESLPRFSAALSQHRPEVVLLMHGVNDLIGSTPGRVQTAADGVEELIKEARNRGAVVFVATLPPFGNGPKASCHECIDPYNRLIRAIAAAKGAALVDVHAAWGGRPGLMGADGIHPTEAGYEVIATAFVDAIQQVLETPAGDGR